MADLPDDQDMVELRALLAKNAEALQRLRTMVERLELALRTLSHKPESQQTEPGPDPTSQPNLDPQLN